MTVQRIPIIENPGTVHVRPGSGEYLRFTLTAGGPVAIFTFVGKDNIRDAPSFPGHPLTTYQWDHLKDTSQQEQLDLLQLDLSFFANEEYRYTVELFDRTNLPVEVILDIRFTGKPTDTAPEGFNVIIV